MRVVPINLVQFGLKFSVLGELSDCDKHYIKKINKYQENPVAKKMHFLHHLTEDSCWKEVEALLWRFTLMQIM